MGITIRPGTEIRDFWPDDTEDEFYIPVSSPYKMSDILDQAQVKWGNEIEFHDLEIYARHIHTHCIGYDLHDGGDYTDFLVVSKIS